MIWSEGIEIAQLGINILLETLSAEEVIKLLEGCKFKFLYIRTENEIVLKDFLTIPGSIFVKDPTRTVLIDLDNEKS